jgi:microcystin-dependent protein
MADPFVAEIRIFPFDFAPRTWAFCNGQPLLISQNTALFSLIGTTYGGDGMKTFDLPDLQGRAPMHPGQMPGSEIVHELGEIGGSEAVTLTQDELPAHTHDLQGTAGIGNLNSPGQSLIGRPFGGGSLYTAAAGAAPVTMAVQALAPTGGGQPHNNMMPFLTFNFCIALAGVFPPRG